MPLNKEMKKPTDSKDVSYSVKKKISCYHIEVKRQKIYDEIYAKNKLLGQKKETKKKKNELISKCRPINKFLVCHLSLNYIISFPVFRLLWFLLSSCVMRACTWWNDKIVVLKKTTLQLYFKTFIEKINSGNLILRVLAMVLLS